MSSQGEQASQKKLKDSTKTKLFIKNVPSHWTLDNFKSAFKAYGEIKDAFLPVDKEKKRRDFGILTFVEPGPAAQVLSALSKPNAEGLVASYARPPPSRPLKRGSVDAKSEEKKNTEDAGQLCCLRTGLS